MAFIFDTSKGETPQSAARKREFAQAIMMGNRGAPKNVGEGLNAIGQAIIARTMMGEANAAEAAGNQSWQPAWQAAIGSMGQSGFPAAPRPITVGGTGPSAKPTMGDVATNRVAQAHSSSALPGSFLSALDRTEGAGDYDTLFGHAQKSGPFAGVSVSSMPISDVLAFASPSGAYGQHVKGKVGRVATPMGRHQIVGTTLRNAVNELGIDPSTPFNAGTQDTIAAHLARRRIASANTVDGKISALRSEWEGFKHVPHAQMVQIVNDLEAMPSGGAVAANEAMASGQMSKGFRVVNPGIIGGAPNSPPDPNIAPEWATNPNMAGMQPTAHAPIETRATEPMAAPQAPQMAPMLPEPRAIQDRPVQVAQADGGFPMQEMAGRNPQALQGGPDMQKLMELSANPWLPDHQRAWVNAALQQQMQQNDPMYQLQVQQLRRELAAPLKRDTTTINGRLVDAQTGEQIAQFDDPVDPTTAIQEFEYARQRGYEGDFVQFQLDQKRAGATSITNNVGEGSKFYDELDKSQATTFGSLAETGVQARSKMAQIDRLEGLLTQAETGGLAMIKQAAGEYGIATEGLSDIQAAQALINELVPQQRQPGSGPMSDADLALFKQSLPRLINQPGGNQTIINTMRGITQYQIQMGEIADAVADRQLTPAQAREQIRNLPNPLAAITKSEGRDGGGAAPAGVDPADWEYMTPEERKLFQ